MILKFIRTLSLSTLFALGTQSVEAQTSPTDFNLPRDEKNVYGQFDNGMKYIIRHNETPPGKFTTYLHVDTGALNENETQNGLAHFLEHMAFRSSAHFPEGKLVPTLNQMGMLFGADTNAHTNHHETVYKLVLPDNKPETIDTALTIFSDYANAITLDAKDIEHERGVILEEYRTRQGADYRLYKAVAAQLYAGTMLEKHDVIGDAEQIKQFTQASFQQYWNDWYRPEKITLIVAGDIDPQQVIEVAKSKLGTFKARGKSSEDQKARLTTFTTTKSLVFTDPEQVKADVQLNKMLPRREPVTTFQQFRLDIVEEIGEWIINHRIADEISSGKAPYREASVSSYRLFDEIFEADASASGNPQDYQKMLDALVTQLKRGIDHGFTNHEIQLAKQNIISRAQLAVKTEPSVESTAYVMNVSRAVGQKTPILSAQQNLDLTTQALDNITPDEILQAFKNNFQPDNFASIVFLPPFKEGQQPVTTDQISTIVTTAWAKSTEAPVEAASVSSILAADPSPGKIAGKLYNQDLGLTNIVFENGVVLHHKFSDYKKDQVTINFTLPGGMIQETPENKGVSAAASAIFASPATHRANTSQMRDLLVGKNITLAGRIGLDSMTMRLRGIKSDLVTGVQLVNALLTAATIDESTLNDWKQNQLKALEARQTDAEEQLTDLINDQVMAGDPRLTTLTPDDVNKQNCDVVEQWFHQISNNAAVEITVVGDIQVEEATQLINQYFGSLPKRSGTFRDLDKLRQIKRNPGPFVKSSNFTSITNKAIGLAGYISCNELDPERRPLSLIGLILTDRMVQRIRVSEQLVYSIGCRNIPAKGIPETGIFSADAPTDPKNVDKLNNTVIEMIKQFVETGPTDAELATAKKQIANVLSTQMKDPEWWVTQMSELDYKQRKLEDIKSLPGIFQQFSASDLKKIAAKYFTDDRMIKLQAVPK